MHKPILFITIAIFVLSFYSCNPKCDSSFGINARLSSEIAEAGMEVMITTDPINLLRDKNIYAKIPSGEELLLETEFVAEHGVIAKLPQGQTGTLELFTEDVDCTGLVPIIGGTLLAEDESFFFDNPNFVTPIFPEIIVPTLPNLEPIDISNAWISPDDRSYCLWFGGFSRYFRSNDDGTVQDGNPDTPEIDTIFISRDTTTFFLDERSVELGIACGGTRNELFHFNPVSGIVDFDRNLIHIFIDRTGNARIGAVEEYIGSFISPNEVPDNLRTAYLSGGTCNPDAASDQRNQLMVLTSQLTGHQLFLFKLKQ